MSLYVRAKAGSCVHREPQEQKIAGRGQSSVWSSCAETWPSWVCPCLLGTYLAGSVAQQLRSDIGFECWKLLRGARSWTWWSLWVPSHLRYSVLDIKGKLNGILHNNHFSYCWKFSQSLRGLPRYGERSKFILSTLREVAGNGAPTEPTLQLQLYILTETQEQAHRGVPCS